MNEILYMRDLSDENKVSFLCLMLSKQENRYFIINLDKDGKIIHQMGICKNLYKHLLNT